MSAITTVRVRKLRTQTAEAMGVKTTNLIDPVEVMVFGEPRAIVHFPDGPSLVKTASGWGKNGMGVKITNAAVAAIALSDDAKKAGLW